jgi:hypothetical protein
MHESGGLWLGLCDEEHHWGHKSQGTVTCKEHWSYAMPHTAPGSNLATEYLSEL